MQRNKPMHDLGHVRGPAEQLTPAQNTKERERCLELKQAQGNQKYQIKLIKTLANYQEEIS